VNISLTKLPWYGQIAAFVALAAAAVWTYLYYYEMPARADMQARGLQLRSLKADVEKGLGAARKLPQFREQVDDLEGRLTSLRAVLPEEKDAADLLRRLQTVATQSNLTITGFKPAPVVTKPLHVEWPIALELEGNYHNLATFFDRISKFARIVNITGLDVKGRGEADPHATISATCVATTFVLLEKPQATAKPGTKPKAKGGKASAPKKVA
jgi:Tfp pilus assembly protein PilO